MVSETSSRDSEAAVTPVYVARWWCRWCAVVVSVVRGGGVGDTNLVHGGGVSGTNLVHGGGVSSARWC